MDKVVLFLARGCGSGLLRPAPGTWGFCRSTVDWRDLEFFWRDSLMVYYSDRHIGH